MILPITDKMLITNMLLQITDEIIITEVIASNR